MAHEQFRQSGFYPALAHLLEECGEVISAAGKLQRFGPQSVNPFLPPEQQVTNMDWLMAEIADLKLAIAHFEAELKR